MKGLFLLMFFLVGWALIPTAAFAGETAATTTSSSSGGGAGEPTTTEGMQALTISMERACFSFNCPFFFGEDSIGFLGFPYKGVVAEPMSGAVSTHQNWSSHPDDASQAPAPQK